MKVQKILDTSVRVDNFSNKELTTILYKLLAYLQIKEDDSSFIYDDSYNKIYKWEIDRNLPMICGHSYKLVCHESGYDGSGRFIQHRYDCHLVPSNETHLVPKKPGDKK